MPLNDLPNTARQSRRSVIPAIVIAEYNLGGIGDSIYSGTKGAMAQIVGFDLHSNPGTMQVNQKLSPQLLGPLGYGQLINPSNEVSILTGSDIYADIKGLGGDNEAQAMSFKAIYSTITSVDIRVTVQGSPLDNLQVDILESLTGNSLGNAQVSPSNIIIKELL